MISDEEWDDVLATWLPTPMIKKSCNIPDYKWDEAWRSVAKERGPDWDKKALYFLRVNKSEDVQLTDKYACTLFNKHTILVFDVKKAHEPGEWNDDDIVESQLL